MKRKTTKKFIEESIVVHKNKYNYNLTNYIGNKIGVNIICYTHGIFNQTPQHHLNGSGCPSCSNNLPLTTKSFIDKSKKIHKYYDYSLVDYNGSHIKVNIICPIHGIFEQTPGNHLNNQGCEKCNTSNIKGNYIEYFIKKCSKKFRNRYNYTNIENEEGNIILECKKHGIFKIDPNLHIRGKHCNVCELKKKEKKLKNRRDMFFKRCNIIHIGKYEYNASTFKNQNSIIEIICPKHGIFKQKACDHSIGHGCSNCSGNNILTTELFIQKGNDVHNKYYDYSLSNYISANKKVKIICPMHGIFEQNPTNHINSIQGCPKCKTSKGERIIRLYLEKNNINSIEQHTFDDCFYKNKLRFDFYLPEHNICIEYDGIQHFESIRKFGGKKSFELQKKKDLIKNNYCSSNNVKLIRISYYESVFEFLDNEFGLKTEKVKEIFTPFQRTLFNINKFMDKKNEYKFNEMIKEIDHHYKSNSNANSSLRKFFKNIPKYLLEKRENTVYIIKS